MSQSDVATMLRLLKDNFFRYVISLSEQPVSTFWKDIVLDNVITMIKKVTNYKRILGPPAATLIEEVDLSDKTCLVTGASGSIGLEITRCLSQRGVSVLMACRNIYKAKLAVTRTCEKTDKLSYHRVDLASLASVKRCADHILKNEKQIDIIILNAATFGIPWTLTEDRLETTFQVNFLSQYYLLLCLGPVLASDVRVVITSSESHRNLNWPFTMPMLKDISLPNENYTSIKSYNISKLCGILSMHYLSYRWSGTKKSVFCAHPGSFIKTGLCRNWWPYEALYTIMLPFSKTIMQGAGTIVYCATSPELKGQTAIYFNNCKRCDESNVAKDLSVAFKVHNLVLNILQERVKDFECTIKTFNNI